MAILDDIWECAATVHSEAKHNADNYRGYPRYEKRHKDDMAMAQRVMDWVTAQRDDGA